MATLVKFPESFEKIEEWSGYNESGMARSAEDDEGR